MKILKIKLIPRSSKNSIEENNGNELKVKVTAPAVDNKANEALIKLLAKEFKIPRSLIKIIQGKKSKNKIINIL
jgi:hypothetical protein